MLGRALPEKDQNGDPEVLKPHPTIKPGSSINMNGSDLHSEIHDLMTMKRSTESRKSFKRKLESDLDPQQSEEKSKRTRSKNESWQKEIERDEALAEKEELRVAMADSRTREAEAKDQLGHLQE
ncbi:hypothetical protein CR513_16988, partial [Mucuna pruriens]